LTRPDDWQEHSERIRASIAKTLPAHMTRVQAEQWAFRVEAPNALCGLIAADVEITGTLLFMMILGPAHDLRCTIPLSDDGAAKTADATGIVFWLADDVAGELTTLCAEHGIPLRDDVVELHEPTPHVYHALYEVLKALRRAASRAEMSATEQTLVSDCERRLEQALACWERLVTTSLTGRMLSYAWSAVAPDQEHTWGFCDLGRHWFVWDTTPTTDIFGDFRLANELLSAGFYVIDRCAEHASTALPDHIRDAHWHRMPALW
jgi:hypothetical protein